MRKITKRWLIGLLVIVLCSVGGALAAQDYDTDEPDIVSTDPYRGQGNVSLNARVRVTFNEAMDPSSITSETFTVSGDYGSKMVGLVKYGNRTAFFVPFTTFNQNTSYTAKMSGQVRDISGNSLGSDYSWSFSTKQ